MSGSVPDVEIASVVTELERANRVELLYRRHRDTVFQIALRYSGGDVGWAEDITQDVFVTLCRRIDDLDDDETLGGWFYRVTHNRCLTRLRHRAVRDNPAVQWLLGARVRPPANPEQKACHQRDLERVFAAIDRLPPKQRVAFCMVVLDHKTLVEVGDVLGFSKGYVCKLVKRAEASLREQGWEWNDG